MWYRIDFKKLVMQLLPPVLRSPLLKGILDAMVMPLCQVYERFMELKNMADRRLDITCNVQYLEKALNDAFYLKQRQIYIVTPEEKRTEVFYFKHESQKVPVFRKTAEGSGYIMRKKGSSGIKVNFKIMVPDFLCTSLASKESDKYKWVYLEEIKSIINIYKPAGRTFSIELYEYD